jgi:NurA-like 5'-3' nuclease
VDNYRAQIFDRDEAAAIYYARFDENDFAVPLESLINNISEILLFERRT